MTRGGLMMRGGLMTRGGWTMCGCWMFSFSVYLIQYLIIPCGRFWLFYLCTGKAAARAALPVMMTGVCMMHGDRMMRGVCTMQDDRMMRGVCMMVGDRMMRVSV